MNSNDVYQKSDLGREEIRSQSLGVLPREARTLLIMIDGKKTYQSYLGSLNESKMFAEFGGIVPLFELLLEFQCIELKGQSGDKAVETAVSQPQSAPPAQPSAPSISPSNISNASQDQRLPQSQADTTQSVASEPPVARSNSEAEFAAEFNNNSSNKESNQEASKGGFFRRKAPDVSYETIKSDLATYIEKNAPAQDAWGYLLSLEQCENDSQLLALVQRIQKSTSGDGLSRGMDKYLKVLKK